MLHSERKWINFRIIIDFLLKLSAKQMRNKRRNSLWKRLVSHIVFAWKRFFLQFQSLYNSSAHYFLHSQPLIVIQVPSENQILENNDFLYSVALIACLIWSVNLLLVFVSSSLSLFKGFKITTMVDHCYLLVFSLKVQSG